MSTTAARLKALMVAEPALTVAAAESMTCGRVQVEIGSVTGASNYLRGGITAYTLEQKVRHLGVDRIAARRVNCVSAAVAEQMARGACALFRSDLGVATTGYAEPSRAEGVRDPFAWWAVAHCHGARIIALLSGRIECPGASRTDAQAIVAEAAVTELVDYLRAFRQPKK